MNLTIIIGQPGSGKSKMIRERYLQTKERAVFFDCRHSRESVCQLRHEMGYSEHRYLFCFPSDLWQELAGFDDKECEIFIDTPDLSYEVLGQMHRLSEEKNVHFTVTARTIPPNLPQAKLIQL